MKDKKEGHCVSCQIETEKHNRLKSIMDKKCQNRNRVINRLIDLYLENPSIVEKEVQECSKNNVKKIENGLN